MRSRDDRHPHVRGRGMASARSRTRLIERLRAVGVEDERVLAAMGEVPRHCFVDEAMTSRAYDDTALPIGYGQTISQPFIVAEMTRLLIGDEQLDNVLEIGTGSGYQAAVLSHLVGTVYTVERIEPLYQLARARFAELGYRNIRTRLARGDALGLADYGPFDAILVTAGADAMPVSLYEQMRDGARMVVPVAAGECQRLIVVRRQGDQFSQETLDAVSFVPLIEGANN